MGFVGLADPSSLSLGIGGALPYVPHVPQGWGTAATAIPAANHLHSMVPVAFLGHASPSQGASDLHPWASVTATAGYQPLPSLSPSHLSFSRCRLIPGFQSLPPSLSSLNNSPLIPGTIRSWGSHSHGNRRTCGTEEGPCPSLPDAVGNHTRGCIPSLPSLSLLSHG